MNKKRFLAGVAAVLSVGMMLTACGNGNTGSDSAQSGKKTSDFGTGLNVENVGKDPNADYNVSGTVTIAIDTARPTDYEAMIDMISQLYKNIDVKIDYYSHGTRGDNAEEYLSNRAAAGTLPDIIFDEAGSLPTYVLQGWLYPLDEFVKDDPDIKYVPQGLIDDYTYGGKLYALPNQAQFEAFNLNLDILDELNIDPPEPDWTFEDFEELLKKTTTNKYSGIERLSPYDENASCTYGNEGFLGYSKSKKSFYMMGAYSKTLTMMRKLRDYPGLEAWTLRANSSGGESDYIKKFGNGNLNDEYMAFNAGRVAMRNVGTWSYTSTVQAKLGFDWMYMSYPQSKDNPGRLPMHVDHSFMTTGVKDKEAAFQILRFLTYSTEGNITRLSMFDKENEGKYILNTNLYYPTTTHPDVVKKFSSLPGATDIDKYMYGCVEASAVNSRTDQYKIVPNWQNINYDIIEEPTNRIAEGFYSPEQVLPGVQKSATEAVQKAWSEFDAKLKEIQAAGN